MPDGPAKLKSLLAFLLALATTGPAHGQAGFGAYYTKVNTGQPWEALRSYGRAFRLYPKMAAQDWKHILLAILSLLGLEKARLWYDRLRTHRMHLE